ncbi:MAG: tetratricopeptide repeat protein [Acidimicrobiia bacterium]|nr:tetratricopeptide repeat protein [Acidimicrobiia bacterium]
MRVLLLSLGIALLPVGAGAQTPAPPANQTPRDLILAPRNTPLQVKTAVPRGYALIVGVSRYQHLDESKQLRYPESDADAFYRVLISHEGGAFPAENVRFLKGSQATLANIRDSLEHWLPTVALPTDRVVVYFAGHGFVQNGRGFLAPYDVQPDRLDTTAYAMSTLGDVLANKVGANWKVLLTDACHSGKINAETTNEALEQQFKTLPASFLTLTATTEREQSFEDPNLSTGFGFFTYYLVQAFRGYADSDPCDGLITADELIEYVRSNVRRYARARQLSQTPTARGDYEPDMPLGVAQGCLSDGAKSPSMLGTAVIESNMDDVDVYVDGNLIGRISKNQPLTLPSLPSGLHEFRGVREGYEPEQKEVMIAPGQEVTVSLRIRYARQIKKPAQALNDQGEKLLFTRRSSMSLMNLIPIERRQSEADLEKAAALFEKALQVDPSFAIAAYHLGQVNQLLLKYDESVAFFRRAIAIDQSHIDARIECAAVLIERGDPDEAIRELTEAQRLDPDDDQAYAMLARAYWDKGAWGRAVENADRALQIKPSNAQAHLWKADAMRQMAAASTDRTVQISLYADAREGYRTFLDLTNFSTGIGSRLAFHFIGLGIGSRRHADRQGAYDSLRSAGFLGLCLTEQKVGNPLKAREYCRRSLKHAPSDPIAYFLLGNVNRDLFNARQACSYLKDARSSYAKMLELNPHLDESRNARNYVGQIDAIMPQAKCTA